jgi:peptidyl-lysine (3S)-dioxygenase / protease
MSSVPKKSIHIAHEKLVDFSSDVGSLWAQPVKILSELPSPLSFMRDYVALSRPFIVRNAFPRISLDDLISQLSTNPDLTLNVDVTPDGFGDCIRELEDGEKVFILPETRSIGFVEFVNDLRKQRKEPAPCVEFIDLDENQLPILSHKYLRSIADDERKGIMYYSRQNDCLRQELQPLVELFPTSIDFADEAFNAEPDAVNLWIGNEKSVSSMHKDHYENLYCVSSGEKVFTLCPPGDALFLKDIKLSSAQFYYDDSQKCWHVRRNMNENVIWMESNVEMLLNSNDEDQAEYIGKNPLLQHVHPMKVTLSAGDMFYLPALWYHRVTQSEETVAVNYWYDFNFLSPSWIYFNMLQQVNPDGNEFEGDDGVCTPKTVTL